MAIACGGRTVALLGLGLAFGIGQRPSRRPPGTAMSQAEGLSIHVHTEGGGGAAVRPSEA
ncbi:hypothetical protein B7486_72945 [cyanobacterium TDX16]|nr:hypothetical protein B7486_72945 [cyanobacterium TDX16]